MILAMDAQSPSTSPLSAIDIWFQDARGLLDRVGRDGEVMRRLTRIANISARTVGSGGKIRLIGKDFGIVGAPWTVEFSTDFFYNVFEINTGSSQSEDALAGLSPGDLLMVFTETGRDSDVLCAITAAKDRQIQTVGFVGGSSSVDIPHLLDICAWIPAVKTQEVRLAMNLFMHSIWVEVAEILYKKVY